MLDKNIQEIPFDIPDTEQEQFELPQQEQSQRQKYRIQETDIEEDIAHGIAEAQDKQSTEKIWQILLPTALREREITQYIFAAIATLITATLAIYTGSPRLLIGLIIAAMLAYNGISLRLDYSEEKIKEVCLLCVSSRRRRFPDCVQATFRTTEEIPTYYDFTLPGRKNFLFTPNATYILYYNEKSPKVIAAFTQI